MSIAQIVNPEFELYVINVYINNNNNLKMELKKLQEWI
jgi:hypothetical protein